MSEAAGIPETVMVNRCDGCAFRAGTEASTAKWTVMLRDLCVLAGVPFECHDTGAGHLCSGFVDAYTAKLNNGDYDRLPTWKRDVMLRLIDVLHAFADASKSGKPWSDERIALAVSDAALGVCVPGGATGRG